MLRIDHIGQSELATTFSVAGRISSDGLPELLALLERARRERREIRLRLKEVTVVSRDAVRFFAVGPGAEVKLEACPRYISQWIAREMRLTGAAPTRCATRSQTRSSRRSSPPISGSGLRAKR